MGRKKKIVIVRSASLNDWEMQNYLPLVKKHEVLAIGSSKGAYQFTLPIDTKRLLCLGEVFGFIPGGIKFLYHVFGDPQGLIGFGKTITGYDIVNTVERTNYYTLQAVRAKKRGLVKHVVVVCWENIAGLREEFQSQRDMKREIDTYADHFIAGTQMAKKVLLAEGIPADKITIIPFGIDLKIFHPARSNKGFRKRVLFAARLVRGKGTRELFSAAREIIKGGGGNISFLIIGAGSEEQWLRRAVREENVSDNFVFLKPVPYKRLRDLYWSADVLVLPSIPTKNWQEQFGMVLIEAMACGIPVIASRSGAIPEVVGNAGVLVAAGDGTALANAIEEVLGSPLLRSRMRRRGLQRARRYYDCKLIAKKFDRLYESLMQA